MRDQSFNDNGIVVHPDLTPRPDAAREALDPQDHFCQIYDLISVRMGRAHRTLQARPHAEQKAISVESQLRATQAALGRAHESIVEIGRQLEAERRAREDAEAVCRSEQHACGEAMRLLGETVQPLRDLKTAAAEHARQVEQQARSYADLEANRRAADARLKDTQAALAAATALAEDSKLRIEAERRAREEAEKTAYSEQVAREGAVLALIDAQNSAAEQRVKGEQQARAYAELEADRHAVESQLKETEAALAGAVELAGQIKLQVESERCAREEAENARYTDQFAREEGALAMLDIQNAVAEQRVVAEEQARAYAELEAKFHSIEARLKETEEALERSVELAEEMKLQAQIAQSARKEAETRAQIDQQAFEQTVRALRKFENSGEEQARAYAQFEARRRHVQSQFKEMEEACARAEYATYRHAQRHAEITAELEKERRAREEAEAKLESERRSRQQAEQALRKTDSASAFWKKLLPDNR
ncbi:MAG: hypothetical protein QOK44_1049 [Betaproteobacteria bacterium]|nr:hypothetical protein [Betaproteobacteria bacterium]